MALACGQCGAPDDGEFVLCKFCKQPVSAEAQQSAIPCPNPQCRALCRWGKQKCGACQSWIIVSCVFCGSLSPHNQAACMACREPFHGAAERKRQRDFAAQQQQQQQQQQQYGGGGDGSALAAGVFGALAGAAVGSAFGGHRHHDGYATGGDYVAGGDYSTGTDYSVDTDTSGGSDYSTDTDFGDSGGGDFGGGDFGGSD